MLRNLQPSHGEESRKKQIEASREVSSDEMEYEGSPTKSQDTQELKWEPVQSIPRHVTRPANTFNPHPPSASTNSFIPPPPPASWPSTGKSSEGDSDALYSMLMSWYMAGYHTGIFNCLF